MSSRIQKQYTHICTACLTHAAQSAFLSFSTFSFVFGGRAAAAEDEAQRANLTKQQPQQHHEHQYSHTHTHTRIEQRVNENERVLPPYPYKTWGGVVRVNKMQPSGKDAEHAVTTATRKLNSTRDNRLSTIRIHRDRFVCTSLAVGR